MYASNAAKNVTDRYVVIWISFQVMEKSKAKFWRHYDWFELSCSLSCGTVPEEILFDLLFKVLFYIFSIQLCFLKDCQTLAGEGHKKHLWVQSTQNYFLLCN